MSAAASAKEWVGGFLLWFLEVRLCREVRSPYFIFSVVRLRGWPWRFSKRDTLSMAKKAEHKLGKRNLQRVQTKLEFRRALH